jgi:hypothetical protein
MTMPQCDTPLVCGLIIHSAFMLSAAQTLTLTLVLALRFCARSEIFGSVAFESTLAVPQSDFSSSSCSSSCGRTLTVVMFD